jgi:hypothetical protein
MFGCKHPAHHRVAGHLLGADQSAGPTRQVVSFDGAFPRHATMDKCAAHPWRAG